PASLISCIQSWMLGQWVTAPPPPSGPVLGALAPIRSTSCANAPDERTRPAAQTVAANNVLLFMVLPPRVFMIQVTSAALPAHVPVAFRRSAGGGPVRVRLPARPGQA